MDSMDGRWNLFAPAIPLALYEAVLRPYWPGGNQNLINDWANFASYFTIFVYGFVLVSDQKYQLLIQRHGNKAIILSILTSLVLLLFYPVGGKLGLNDPATQTRQCLETIKRALEEAGASLGDVVRTRMLLTRIGDWEQVAKVRGEYFQNIRPVDTVMEVSRFINPEWLVEIEVDAVISED